MADKRYIETMARAPAPHASPARQAREGIVQVVGFSKYTRPEPEYNDEPEQKRTPYA